MKIAVLSDIHANFIAMQTISDHIEAWRPDHVVMAGDLVNRGPRPRECLNFIKDKQRGQGWLVLRGNHEDYVISQAQPDASKCNPEAEVHRGSHWTYQQLGNQIPYLQNMPFSQNLTGPDGLEVHFTHASMLGIRDGIYPATPQEALPKKIGLSSSRKAPALFCVGHTHRPLIRAYKRTLVVNAGSAGLPFDNNRQLAYAQLAWQNSGWQAKIIRLPYDIQQAERDFYDNGYLEGGGPLVRLVLIELRTASSQLFHWAIRYQERILAGEISMEESVEEYLQAYNV